MITKYGTFDAFVIVAVMLTGAGFGALTGLVYSEDYWWVGIIVGGIISFPLAKFYLRQLPKISAKGYGAILTWSLSTYVAIFCGLICTVLTHAIMMVIGLCEFNEEVMYLIDKRALLLCTVSGLIGVVAAVIVGGICSCIFVLLEKERGNAIS